MQSRDYNLMIYNNSVLKSSQTIYFISVSSRILVLIS